jgi:hypothetical protein
MDRGTRLIYEDEFGGDPRDGDVAVFVADLGERYKIVFLDGTVYEVFPEEVRPA